jgi:hypothetical protein
VILYLHGFRSSPQSAKAQQLAEAARARGIAFASPQLPASPQEAMMLCEELLNSSATPVTVVGSSLGGYYATWLAERHALRAVLVNPAVVAHLDLAPYVGTLTQFHSGEPFEFTRDHVDEMRALEVTAITRPQRYWLLVEEGDEVLDYRLAVAKYGGARQTVLAGGDHSFTHWKDYLDDVLRFAAAG